MTAYGLTRWGRTYTFQRYAPPAINPATGRLQPSAPVLNDGQPWTMLAVVQPISGMQALMLPEGLRDRQGVTVYTDVMLQVSDDAKQLFGDRFTWNDYVYEITSRFDWGTAPLPNKHYKYLAFRPKPGQTR